MSITTQPAESIAPVDEVDASGIYREEIIADSGICTRCFRRTHDKDGQPIRECYPPRITTPDIMLECDPVDIPLSWRRATPPETPYCLCGSIDDDATRSTLSKEAAVECAERISERLAEKEIGHRRELLLEVVRQAKGTEGLQGKDDKILSNAVKFAVRKTRRKI